jgi:hypothetical protein
MLSRHSPKFPNNILSHWYAIAGGVHFSANDFYESILGEITARKVPQLKLSRVAYHEGGVFSDKRMYLRLARERYAFDVCAAPFGEGYFFSLRFVEVPRGGWLRFVGLIIVAFLIWLSATHVDAETYWWILLSLLIGSLIYWLIRAARRKPQTGDSNPPARRSLMPDFDSFFLGLPVIGGWYERSRRNTYYRHDTRLLYHAIISEIVRTKVEEFTAAKGVKLLRTYDYNPILGELYKPVDVRPGTK